MATQENFVNRANPVITLAGTINLHFFTLLLIALIVILSTDTPSMAADIPLGHPVYRFVERCEIRGLLDHPLSGSRPYSRLTVARCLAEIDHRTKELNPVEKRQLDYYRFLFADELNRLGESQAEGYMPSWNRYSDLPLLRSLNIFTNDRDLLSVYGDDWGFVANANFSGSTRREEACVIGGEPGSEMILSNGFEARLYWQRFELFGAATDAQVSGDPACFDTVRYPYRKYASTGKDNFDFYDTETSLGYEDSRILVQFGKGKNRWGHGKTGSLALSNHALPYTHFRARGHFGSFEMTYLHGKLVQEPPIFEALDTLDNGAVRKHYADKYLAGHRIQIDITRDLQLGFFETVIYGERGFELEYLHPLMFLRGAEHYTRDRDNMFLGFDLRLKLFQRLSLHAEVLFDDLQFSKITSDTSKNKHAILIGAKVVDPLGLSNSLAFLEYAYVRPYVYTHKFPINVATHYGAGMGYPGQPNSDVMAAGLDVHLMRELVVTIRAQRSRHGANTAGGLNFGGFIRQSEKDNGEPLVPLLEGDLETTNRIELGAAFEPLYDLHMYFNFGHDWRSVEYYAGGRDDDIASDWLLGFTWHPLR